MFGHVANMMLSKYLFLFSQRNEAGSSPAMEYMAFNQCMTYLLGIGLGISTFISDRHTGIAKHMREKLGNIKHYFDLWHLKKCKLICVIIAT